MILVKSLLSYYNEVEGRQITGKTELEEILDEMMKKYPETSVVLTLGDKVVIYQQGEVRYNQPSFAVEVVDTTAVGDTFTGFYLAEIMRGEPVFKALEVAAKAASIAVGRLGAAPSIPKLEEL